MPTESPAASAECETGTGVRASLLGFAVALAVLHRGGTYLFPTFVGGVAVAVIQSR